MVSRPRSILIIEDDLDLRRLLVKFLASEDYDVRVADNVANAMTELFNGVRFDLAIVDFWLGSETAVSVIDRIYGELPNLPFIVISGGNDVMDLELTQAIADISGAISFLQKPFTKSAFMKVVGAALRAN